jgi:hypothetical protein
MKKTVEVPACSLCGMPVEAWPGRNPETDKPYGYGHNPDPLADLEKDGPCCQHCNDTKVVPARLAIIFGERRQEPEYTEVHESLGDLEAQGEERARPEDAD